MLKWEKEMAWVTFPTFLFAGLWCDNWQLYIKTGYYSNTLTGLQETKDGGQIKIQVTA